MRPVRERTQALRHSVENREEVMLKVGVCPLLLPGAGSALTWREKHTPVRATARACFGGRTRRLASTQRPGAPSQMDA